MFSSFPDRCFVILSDFICMWWHTWSSVVFCFPIWFLFGSSRSRTTEPPDLWTVSFAAAVLFVFFGSAETHCSLTLVKLRSQQKWFIVPLWGNLLIAAIALRRSSVTQKIKRKKERSRVFNTVFKDLQRSWKCSAFDMKQELKNDDIMPWTNWTRENVAYEKKRRK